MKKTFRLLCLLIVCIMAASLFTGCAPRRKAGDPPIFTSDKRVVIKIGDYNVTYDFYRFLFLNSKDFFDNGDASYWQEEGNDAEKVKEYVLDSLLELYAYFTLADKYDVKLSNADIREINDELKSAKSGYTDEEFKTEIATAYLNEELYLFSLKTQKLKQLIYSKLISETEGVIKVDDSTLDKALETDFARASHILFTYNNETEKEKKKALAESVLEKLKNGEDFEALKEKHSDDNSLKGNRDGYYFTHGEFQNMFEYAAFDLEIGEISEIVTTNVGMHIVKRLPLEEEYINQHYEELRMQCITAKFYDLVNGVKKGLKVEYKDEYKAIKLDSFDKE
jgi:parvulin-like peptidyl-prolyl isomerase